jgi:CDP-2,3-bis-(O-geranylgeranyl)-sn-glycerol synthase
MNALHDIWLALWFFLPAGAGNVAPIFVAKMPLLRRFNAPLDCGKMFMGKRLLGDHKTWRGIIAGGVAAVLVLWLQVLLARHISWLSTSTMPVDYAALPIVPLGLLQGLGALFGDALKSFFKRRLGSAPGELWFPFDQVDYIVGGALAAAVVVILPWAVYVWALILWPTIHIVSTSIGYLLGLKDQPV